MSFPQIYALLCIAIVSCLVLVMNVYFIRQTYSPKLGAWATYLGVKKQYRRIYYFLLPVSPFIGALIGYFSTILLPVYAIVLLYRFFR